MDNSRFYIYAIINPETKRVEYLGKGTNGRYAQHWRDMLKDTPFPHNSRLRKKLRSIKDAGYDAPLYEFWYRTDDADLAYLIEASAIDFVGLENLCNGNAGGVGRPLGTIGRNKGTPLTAEHREKISQGVLARLGKTERKVKVKKKRELNPKIKRTKKPRKASLFFWVSSPRNGSDETQYPLILFSDMFNGRGTMPVISVQPHRGSHVLFYRVPDHAMPNLSEYLSDAPCKAIPYPLISDWLRISDFERQYKTNFPLQP